METLTTARLTLRPVARTDAEAVFELYSSPEVCETYDIEPFREPIQAHEHVSRWLRLAGEGKQLRYAIVHETRVIGTCGLYSIRRPHKRASLGFDLLPAYWRRGLMIEALRAFVPHCVQEHGLQRVPAFVLPDNRASSGLLEKLGFGFEGVLRRYELWAGNGLVDLAVYARVEWSET